MQWPTIFKVGVWERGCLSSSRRSRQSAGFRRFDAEVLFANGAMLRVFEDAGFAVRRASSFDEVTVSLDITPSEAMRERIDKRDHLAAVASLRPLLAPSSIAVVGAAEAPGNVGRAVLANITAE